MELHYEFQLANGTGVSVPGTSQVAALTSKYLHRCPLCSSKFVNKYSVSRHVKTHHLKDEKFNCRICSRRFTNHAAFVSHLKQHTASAARPYACELCGKAYLTGSDLAKHRCSKASGTGAPSLPTPADRQCRSCARKLSSASALAAHRLVHTGQRPWACARCPYRAASRANLRHHELCRHTDGRRPLRCGQCGRGFATAGCLAKHRRDTHAAQARHACPLCGRRYRHRPTLSRHIRLSHSAAPVVLDESVLDLHDLNLNIGPEVAHRIAGEIMSGLHDDSSSQAATAAAAAAAASVDSSSKGSTA